MSSKAEKRILVAIILIYIVAFGTYTALRHHNFQTETYDLGIFVQTFWNTIHGRIMANSIEAPGNHFGVHMSPFLFLLAPGYALFPSPYYLLIIQTIALALGAIPLYLLAKRLLPSKNLPLIITAGYLLYPSLHWVNSYDFHSVAFLIPLLLAAFYFLHIKNWLWSGIFLTLAASTKEDAILVVLFVGIFLLLKKSAAGEVKWLTTQRKFGLAVVLLSTFYFLLSMQVVIPAFSEEGFLFFYRYSHLGKDFSEIVKNIFIQPGLFINTLANLPKFNYLFWLFLPAAFLPIFSGCALILLIPGLAENLLSQFQSQFTGFYQYDALLIPGIFICLIFGLKTILGWRPQWEKILRGILFTTILVSFVMRSPLGLRYFPTSLLKPGARRAGFEQLVRMMPNDVSIAAHTNLVPHLSHREHIYMSGMEPSRADVVLLDGADPSFFIYDEVFQQYADSYMMSGDYDFKIIDERYFILYKKGVRLLE